ncbi:glycine cleavage system protein GcvH [Nocardioides sp. CFH 31398]|uniref:glycine cleavage system protein GcvH n=1 Tax=Nocardioides sp. CFH 31398 TaxID=2919579 RepID=UPI001F070887|nr:glycine cleavage system protein GcvH [Nocardioides sp. CFH 31398]MCH1866979.1 glycine cleavage system protein GcvH [Nocardioides sp. CFH 31398]
MSQTPPDLHYTPEHEWVADPDGDGAVRVGITDFAQGELGDIVYVDLPEAGTEVHAGSTCGELESTKSVSDVYAPVSGTVTAVNPALEATPELVNSDPYGEGWLFEVRPDDADAVGALMDAAAYSASLES